jgi:hypothetical protein
MAVSGGYLAMQMRGWLMRPVLVFRQYIFSDILPGLSNLGERAEQMASDYYNRIGAQPAGEYEDVDMACVADDAHEISLGWYETMVPVRQTMLNLLAAGIFHLAEQQLAQSCRDVSFDVIPPPKTRLGNIETWYRTNFHLELKTLPSWPVLDELRHVANAVKHGEGGSAEKLKALRPKLFSNPDYVEFYEKEGIESPVRDAQAPLTGEDLFVTEDLLRMYIDTVEALFGEIADYFESRARDFFPY